MFRYLKKMQYLMVYFSIFTRQFEEVQDNLQYKFWADYKIAVTFQSIENST